MSIINLQAHWAEEFVELWRDDRRKGIERFRVDGTGLVRDARNNQLLAFRIPRIKVEAWPWEQIGREFSREFNVEANDAAWIIARACPDDLMQRKWALMTTAQL